MWINIWKCFNDYLYSPSAKVYFIPWKSFLSKFLPHISGTDLTEDITNRNIFIENRNKSLTKIEKASDVIKYSQKETKNVEKFEK